MKMKDVFKDGLIKLPSWFNDSQKKYIVDALHCHDKLTEENAKLREALTELVQLANHPLTVDALDITQSTEMDRAKKLLRGGEDE